MYLYMVCWDCGYSRQHTAVWRNFKLRSVEANKRLRMPLLISLTVRNVHLIRGAVVAEWLSPWLVEQEVRGSIPRLYTWISEIGYLLLPSRDMAEILLKRRKSSIQLTNQPSDMCGDRCSKWMLLQLSSNAHSFCGHILNFNEVFL